MIRWCDNGHPPMRVESGRRCTACSIRREAVRPSRQARGYGAAHTRARAALASMLPTLCAYGCGRLLSTPDEMVAAHVVDGDPSAGWMASCRSCNESHKGGVPPRSDAIGKGPAQRCLAPRMRLDAS